MKIVTKHSTYEIIPQGSFFKVTKIAETIPNPNGINVSYGWECDDIYIKVGFSASLGRIRTSTVLHVEP